jgi:hypothetical protein
MMKIRSDLPIKYYLNVYNEEHLQDDLTILFDIIQYLTKVIQAKDKDLSLENFKFTSKSMKYIFGDKLKDETFKQNLVKRLKTLIATDNISVTGETMKITETGLIHFYKI